MFSRSNNNVSGDDGCDKLSTVAVMLVDNIWEHLNHWSSKQQRDVTDLLDLSLDAACEAWPQTTCLHPALSCVAASIFLRRNWRQWKLTSWTWKSCIGVKLSYIFAGAQELSRDFAGWHLSSPERQTAVGIFSVLQCQSRSASYIGRNGLTN